MNIGILSPGDNIWRATLAVSTFYVCIEGFLIPCCFVMSVWDLSSDDGRDTALDLTKTPDLTLCEPQAFSTAMENENKESGYATIRTKRQTRRLWTKTHVFQRKCGMDKGTRNWIRPLSIRDLGN